MLLHLLRDATVYPALCRMDEDLASQHQAKGCPQCKGRLHVANYPRQPRGVIDVPGDRTLRFSFCCANDGCRRRQTPPSVRFFDHKVYLGVVITLVAALAQGMAQHQVRALRESLGIDRRTFGRWQEWWREVVPKSTFWKEARARFIPPVNDAALPHALLDRFVIGSSDALMRLLSFLNPLSLSAAL